MNDLALSKKMEELIKENSSLIQENRMLKHQKDRLGINYITIPEKGDAQSLLNGEIPFLKKIPELSLIKDDKDSDALFEVDANTDHLLIESDNLSALVTLQHTHADKIDVIYIDPPYNTGNKDFVYNDSFVSNDDGFRHSKWLSFMRPRLELAKKLLSETGVIFVSIDDNEQAYLKVLMDEIFGEQNFVANLSWVTKNGARGVPPVSMIMSNHEYVLCYGANKNNVRMKGMERSSDDFSNPDDDIRGLWRSESIVATGKQNNYFTIVDPDTGNEFYRNWAFSKSSISDMIAQGLIIFPKTSTGTPRQKKFFDSYRNATKPLVSYLGWFSTENSSKDLMAVLGRGKFDFPKPMTLVKHLVNQASSQDSIVLDFFAGSGTTGHAVAELNAEDGGTRQAILITNSGEASRLSREDFKKSVNALTDSQLSILKEKIIVDEQVNSNSLPVRTSPNKWGKKQESFEIKKSGLFATIVGSANEHYVRWQKICDYLEIENVFDPVNLASDVTAERMKRVLTGKNWSDGKKHNSLPGNLQYYKLELDNLTKDVYSIPDKINLQKYVGVVSLEENAHNVLEQLPDTYKDGNNSIENNDAIVLSSDDKLVLVYGNYDKALFAEDDFINTVNNVKNFAEITNKVFKLYVVSTENEIFTIDDFVATPYPILYTTKVDKTVSTLEKQGFLVKDVESN